MTFKQIRNLFFSEYPQFKNERKRGKNQNQFSCDCRCYFIDFIEHLRRDGTITQSQADRITLIG